MYENMKLEKVRLVWVDLEMSGLLPLHDVILEAAFIITDGNLNTIVESETWAVHQPDTILNHMDKWNTEVHGRSGLTERCRESTVDTAQCERSILKFLKKYVEAGRSPICGNSICQDRRFLAQHMPKVEKFFHYRNFDVSSFKIAAQLFHPKLTKSKNDDKDAHQALHDIRESILEMRFYLDNMLRPPRDD